MPVPTKRSVHSNRESPAGNIPDLSYRSVYQPPINGRSPLRQVKYLNNIVEQDHRNVKRLTRPGLGFGGFWTARRTLAGYEAMALMKKGQLRNICGNDIRAQATFIAGLFQVAV